MNYENLYMVRGDTYAFAIEIEGLGQELDSAYFTCKENFEDETPIFQKSLGDGITKDNEHSIEGKIIYKVRVAPEDTKNIVPKNYYYDLEIGANSDIYTILKGVLKIDNDVTHEEVE